MKLSRLAPLALLLPLNLFAATLVGQTAKDIRAKLAAKPSNYEIVISDQMAAFYQKGGGTSFYYDEDIATLRQFAKEVNKTPIVVKNANANDILIKAGLEAATKPVDPKAPAAVLGSRLDGDKSLAVEDEKSLQKFDSSKTLGKEAACLNFFATKVNAENLWSFAGTHGGERGLYLMTPAGLNFYPLNPYKDFKSCVGRSDEFDYYSLKVKLTGIKAFYLTISDSRDVKGNPGLVYGPKPPERGNSCTITDHQVLDEESKKAMYAEISAHVSKAFADYTADRKDAMAAARANSVVPLPNPKNYENVLEACAKANSPALQAAAETELKKFRANPLPASPRIINVPRDAIR